MLIVYVAHPIGGDVRRNMELVEERCGEIFRDRPEVIPIAPYLMALKFLDDANPADRLRGVGMNREFFFRKMIDEVWLFGPRISNGMWEEVGWSRGLGIPVVPMSGRLMRELAHRELNVGSIIQIGTDGPGGQCPAARFLGYMENDEGVRVRLRTATTKRLIYHDIEWLDVSYVAPYGVPIVSPRRYESASVALLVG